MREIVLKPNDWKWWYWFMPSKVRALRLINQVANDWYARNKRKVVKAQIELLMKGRTKIGNETITYKCNPKYGVSLNDKRTEE